MSEHRPELDARPPILGRWRNVYLIVVAVLVLQVVVYTLLTRIYS
jgi:hypothetical protein